MQVPVRHTGWVLTPPAVTCGFVSGWVPVCLVLIGLIAAVINMCVGAVIGGLCGYYGGKLDMIVMRIVDILYGIPNLIIVILVMIVLGRGMATLIVAMCITGWIGTCRFIRGEVYRLKEQDYVLAAKVLGVSDFKIIIRHIIPKHHGYDGNQPVYGNPRRPVFQEAFLSYIRYWVSSRRSVPGVILGQGRYPEPAYRTACCYGSRVLYLYHHVSTEPAGRWSARCRRSQAARY